MSIRDTNLPRPAYEQFIFPEPAQSPTPEEIRRALAEMRKYPLVFPALPQNNLSSEIVALTRLLGLSDDERSFLAHLARTPNEVSLIRAFTDWLKERGREEDAAAVSELEES